MGKQCERTCGTCGRFQRMIGDFGLCEFHPLALQARDGQLYRVTRGTGNEACPHWVANARTPESDAATEGCAECEGRDADLLAAHEQIAELIRERDEARQVLWRRESDGRGEVNCLRAEMRALRLTLDAWRELAKRQRAALIAGEVDASAKGLPCPYCQVMPGRMHAHDCIITEMLAKGGA